MDIYAAVTDRIIAQMEQGIIPWHKPWVAAGNCISHATGKPYSLLNQMILGKPGMYFTFNQIQKLGGRGVAPASVDDVLRVQSRLFFSHIQCAFYDIVCKNS